jgi:hypothetical protein
MGRRALALAGALAFLGLNGCQILLPQVWSFSDCETHARQLDSEMGHLREDVRDIFFGIEPSPVLPPWRPYGN